MAPSSARGRPPTPRSWASGPEPRGRQRDNTYIHVYVCVYIYIYIHTHILLCNNTNKSINQ